MERNCNYCGIHQEYHQEGLKWVVTKGAHLCTRAEKERQHFMELLKERGSIKLERRIQRMESYRKYDSKYPYDVAGTSVELEVAYNLAGETIDPLQEIIIKESVEELLSPLTQVQREQALMYADGFRPKDIADMEGRENSGSIRWQKHNIKLRMEDTLKAQG